MANLLDKALGAIKEVVTTAIVGGINGVLNPGITRLGAAGLLIGGGKAKNSKQEVVVNIINGNGIPVERKDDWRIRVSVAPSSGILYTTGTDSVLAPLAVTNGVIFPYTPTVTLNYTANYSPQKFTHSNYPAFSYENSEVSAIQIAGDFTVQDVNDGKYLLACLYFFRASTKMFFGSGAHVGNPPPIVFLDGYGKHYLPHVPCIVTGFSHTMPNEVDYISIPVDGGNTRLPTTSQITITLQPVYSKKTIATFNLEQFAAGKLVDRGFI